MNKMDTRSFRTRFKEKAGQVDFAGYIMRWNRFGWYQLLCSDFNEFKIWLGNVYLLLTGF